MPFDGAGPLTAADKHGPWAGFWMPLLFVGAWALMFFDGALRGQLHIVIGVYLWVHVSVWFFVFGPGARGVFYFMRASVERTLAPSAVVADGKIIRFPSYEEWKEHKDG